MQPGARSDVNRHEVTHLAELATESCWRTLRAKLGMGRRRFTFELSPGQVPLAIKSPFTLAPKDGIFVRPVVRTARAREHARAEE